MFYTTEPLSLLSWTRIRERIQQEFSRRVQQLGQSMQPVQVTPETFAAQVAHAQLERHEVLAKLTSLEQLQVLAMLIDYRMGEACHTYEITDLEVRLACMRTTAEAYRVLLQDLPSRELAQSSLDSLGRSLNGLRSSRAEDARADRARIQAEMKAIALPLVGREDLAPYVELLNSYEGAIERTASKIEQLRVNTLFTLRLAEDAAQALEAFGVGMAPEINADPAVPQEPAEAGAEHNPEPGLA